MSVVSAPAKTTRTASVTDALCPECYRFATLVTLKGVGAEYWCFRCHPVAVAPCPIEAESKE